MDKIAEIAGVTLKDWLALHRWKGMVRGPLTVLVAIAIAGCVSDEERAENQRRSSERSAAAYAEREAHRAYRRCTYEATGFFGSASIEVVKHCEAKAGAARKHLNGE